MTAGPTIQLRKSEVPMSLRSAVTSPILEYFTLARTGYIMASNPMAIGSDTVSTLIVSSVSFSPGKPLPSRSPTAMARRIQIGR